MLGTQSATQQGVIAGQVLSALPDELDGALTLSAVKKLLEERSSYGRMAMLQKAVSNYHSDTLGSRERRVAEDMFRLLARDVELQVRQALAEHLKHEKQVPADIIRMLVEDEEPIALPVLQASQVLSEAELICIARDTASVGKLLAIAGRRQLGEGLSEALVVRGVESVTLQLVRNDGAEISTGTYETILSRHAGNRRIAAGLASRELPVTVAAKLVSHVSEALGNQLRSRYRLNAAALQGAVRQVQQQAEQALICDSDLEAVIALVSHLAATDRLTPQFVFQAIAGGRLRLAACAMARRADIATSNAVKLIFDPGDLGFAALYGHAELPMDLLQAVNAAVKVQLGMRAEGWRAGTPKYGETLRYRLERDHGQVAGLQQICKLIPR